MKKKEENYCSPQDSISQQKAHQVLCPAHSPQARDALCGGRGALRHISATQESRVWTCLRNWQCERHLVCNSRLHCVKLIARSLWEVWWMPCAAPRLQGALSPSGRRRIAVDNEWEQHQAVWKVSKLQDSQQVCPCEICTWCHTLGVPLQRGNLADVSPGKCLGAPWHV